MSQSEFSFLLHRYLRLLENDQNQPDLYNDLRVKLYAEYEPENLLNYLRVNQSYQTQKALDVCQERGLVNEQVYLLGRVGEYRRALELIVNSREDATFVSSLNVNFRRSCLLGD